MYVDDESENSDVGLDNPLNIISGDSRRAGGLPPPLFGQESEHSPIKPMFRDADEDLLNNSKSDALLAQMLTKSESPR